MIDKSVLAISSAMTLTRDPIIADATPHEQNCHLDDLIYWLEMCSGDNKYTAMSHRLTLRNFFVVVIALFVIFCSSLNLLLESRSSLLEVFYKKSVSTHF